MPNTRTMCAPYVSLITILLSSLPAIAFRQISDINRLISVSDAIVVAQVKSVSVHRVYRRHQVPTTDWYGFHELGPLRIYREQYPPAGAMEYLAMLENLRFQDDFHYRYSEDQIHDTLLQYYIERSASCEVTATLKGHGIGESLNVSFIVPYRSWIIPGPIDLREGHAYVLFLEERDDRYHLADASSGAMSVRETYRVLVKDVAGVERMNDFTYDELLAKIREIAGDNRVWHQDTDRRDRWGLWGRILVEKATHRMKADPGKDLVDMRDDPDSETDDETDVRSDDSALIETETK